MSETNTSAFWGVIVPPNSSISQVSETSFKITKACIKLPKDNVKQSLVSTLYFTNEDEDEFILCHLNTTSKMQTRLSLCFNEEDVANFRVEGPCEIHLTGFVMGGDLEDQDDADFNPLNELLMQKGLPGLANGSMDEDDFDSDEDNDDSPAEEENGGCQITELDDTLNDSDDDNEEDEEDNENADDFDEDDSDDEMEIPQLVQPKKKKNTEQIKTETNNNKKRKLMDRSSEENTSITEKKTKVDNKKVTKNILKGGIISMDEKVGSGNEAVPGKKLSVYYVGKLAKSGKIFDQCKSGKAFDFRLGKQEVIKGWDIGMKGMKVGGKRTLTIPPKFAYGQQAQDKIPAGSTLIFEVELKDVKK